ncbi:hypothetical protein BJY04DRAFT_199119 [Aspergillus karnatakaensis]|uniref:aromatic alcohol reductase n=1 Tax=Aspergillus karnatakaensis TaxID=1810916 RepID=UPI003CCC9A16
MSPRILVLGAGELGTQVLLSLAQHPAAKETNAPISVLLRPSTISSPSPGKEKELATLNENNITFIPGDVATDTPATLSSTFKDYHTIISCTGFSAGRGTQLKIANAVLAAKVPRFIPWQFGVDYDIIGRGSAQDLFDEQLDVRDLLRSEKNKETKWVIISTGMFTSFLFEPGLGVVDLEKNVVRALGGLDVQVTVTSVKDIGRVTAEVVFRDILGKEEFGNKAIRVAGDTVSYRRVADTLEGVLGRKFERKVRTVEDARRDLERDPGNGLYKYEVVFGEERTGVAWSHERSWNVRRGYIFENVERWVRRNLV